MKEHTYTIILGNGSEESKFAQWVRENHDEVTLDEWIMQTVEYVLVHDCIPTRGQSLVSEWHNNKVNA